VLKKHWGKNSWEKKEGILGKRKKNPESSEGGGERGRLAAFGREKPTVGIRRKGRNT